VFERFTEGARQVIILAREEAGRFRHDFVGTEHVLLALIRDGEGIATAVLHRLGLRLEAIKAELERALAEFPNTLAFGEVPFTPQAKRILELSIEEARQLGLNYIGTEHLLLGLMKEGQSIAAKILESLGARLDEVRRETLVLLGDQRQLHYLRHLVHPRHLQMASRPMPTESLLAIARREALEAERRALAEVLAQVNCNLAEATVGEATEQARRVIIILAPEEAGRLRHDFIGTEHVLLGLIRCGEGVATAVLQRLGLPLDVVKAEVEQVLAGFPKCLTFGEVLFTPQAKRVVELSIEEARQLGHRYIGTEHLLLGLMKEGQSIAAKILESFGARLDEVRQETLAMLGDLRQLPLFGDPSTEGTSMGGIGRTPAASMVDPETTGVPSLELIAEHPEMQKLARLVTQVARTTATVLITGESGNELIARAIHHRGPRRDKPFVRVNLAAIPDAVVDSELFGYEKGAFTGAHQRKLGRFELAQDGTLFLDEIGLLRAEVQAKLVRVLQEREIARVGGTRSIRIDVRIIAATTVDLKRAVAAGTFREDLYYRLNVAPITVPPLDVTAAPGRSGPGQVPETLRQASDRFERIIVQRALQEVGGNVSEAARVLGMRLRDVQGPEMELAGLVRQERVLAAGVLGYPKLPSWLMFISAALVTLAVIYVLAKCCS